MGCALVDWTSCSMVCGVGCQCSWRGVDPLSRVFASVRVAALACLPLRVTNDKIGMQAAHSAYMVQTPAPKLVSAKGIESDTLGTPHCLQPSRMSPNLALASLHFLCVTLAHQVLAVQEFVDLPAGYHDGHTGILLDS